MRGEAGVVLDRERRSFVGDSFDEGAVREGLLERSDIGGKRGRKVSMGTEC